MSALGWPVLAWATASAVGVVVIQQDLVPALAVLAPLVTVALSVVLYLPAVRHPRHGRAARARSADGSGRPVQSS